MKTHLKAHRIGPKIGFSHNFMLLNPDFGPRHMDLLWDDDNQSKWLPHPELVHIKHIKPMNTHKNPP